MNRRINIEVRPSLWDELINGRKVNPGKQRFNPFNNEVGFHAGLFEFTFDAVNDFHGLPFVLFGGLEDLFLVKKLRCCRHTRVRFYPP
jgi:hypothetical protein